MGESRGRSLSAICLQHSEAALEAFPGAFWCGLRSAVVEAFLFVLMAGPFLRRCCDGLLHYTV